MKQAKLLTEPEFRRLTAIVNSLRYPTRNHTIVALSFYAGLRACEHWECRKNILKLNTKIRVDPQK